MHMAPHLRRRAPGTPNIIIRDMPGATGVVAMNDIYKSGPKDGSAIIASFNMVMLAPLFGDRRLNETVKRAYEDPEIHQRFKALGLEPSGGSPERVAAMLQRESATWEQVARDKKIEPQ